MEWSVSVLSRDEALVHFGPIAFRVEIKVNPNGNLTVLKPVGFYIDKKAHTEMVSAVCTAWRSLFSN